MGPDQEGELRLYNRSVVKVVARLRLSGRLQLR